MTNLTIITNLNDALAYQQLEQVHFLLTKNRQQISSIKLVNISLSTDKNCFPKLHQHQTQYQWLCPIERYNQNLLDQIATKLDSDNSSLLCIALGEQSHFVASGLTLLFENSDFFEITDLTLTHSDTIIRKASFNNQIMSNWSVHIQNRLFLTPSIEATKEKLPTSLTEKNEIELTPFEPALSQYSGIELLESVTTIESNSLKQAHKVIAIGRGISSQDQCNEVEQLFESLGWSVGASRPVVMNAWITMPQLIGVSNQIVNPKLCLVSGASGSGAFLSGMNQSKTVIAINSNKNAPIFQHADIGIVGDAYSVSIELAKKIANAPLLGKL